MSTGGSGGSGSGGQSGSADTCNNNKRRDGTETDIDCGGDTCPPCAERQSCKVDGDCMSDSCNLSRCQCKPATCDASECGQKSDGCGRTLRCPMSCSGSSRCVSNQCTTDTGGTGGSGTSCDKSTCPDNCNGPEQPCCSRAGVCGCNLFGDALLCNAP